MATNKNWFTRLRRAVKTGDNDTMNELLESAPSNVTGDDSGDLPQGVNLNINLSPQNPMPDKNPEMGGQPTGDDNAEVPAWAQALISRLDALEGKTTDSDNPDGKDKTGDSDEDDEEETTATGDSAYRAELILPGIDLKQAMKPTAFKRHILATADQSLVRQIVGDAAIKTLNKSVVDMAFTAVSELAKSRNTAAQRTADAAQRTTDSISSLNQRNQEFWAKR